MAVASLALASCRGSGNALRAPDPAALARVAPDSFVVTFTTSRGPFDLLVRRAWSPRGADRVHYLVNAHYYDGVRFFRVVKGFVAQFGLHGDSAITAAWRTRQFPDDSVRASNLRGMVSFAKGGPNTRTTQLFINLADNARLDALGFPPIGQVVAGMAVVDSLYNGYGEGAPRGSGPDQGRIGREGNAYLAREFPKLDSVVTARVTRRW
ncbi:MAG: peptidylprolyl isomerase [Gemmatimonadetes bacterium]|nr:peptidylprolyl isomerase [Gemmatimonadota bacterium]